MPQTSKTTTEERIKAVEDYLSEKRGYSQILRELKITSTYDETMGIPI